MDQWTGQADKLRTIMLTGKRLFIEKGQVIRTSEDNNNFFLIHKGYAKRYLITNDGRIDIQSFYGPGYYFPLITVFSGLYGVEIYKGPETYYYESITDCEVYMLDIDKVREAVEADPSIYRELLLIAGRRIESNIQQLENRSLRSYHKRVAHQIAYFADKFSDLKGDKAKLKIPLTQQDLSDVLSTTRETVSLCMSELKKKGLIKSGKYIVVNSVKKLKAEAFK